MSIHDFHSKLMSGKEEGTLFEALRRLRGIGKPALASGEEPPPPGWTFWMDSTESGSAELGWMAWETTGSEAISHV
jgi:hypothetical protein